MHVNVVGLKVLHLGKTPSCTASMAFSQMLLVLFIIAMARLQMEAVKVTWRRYSLCTSKNTVWLWIKHVKFRIFPWLFRSDLYFHDGCIPSFYLNSFWNIDYGISVAFNFSPGIASTWKSSFHPRDETMYEY